ncbi:MAG: FHA domain-containing protein [Actinobacteria bacterium]|nr:FHA domain-containing protein [Actinomycetota bacterium]
MRNSLLTIGRDAASHIFIREPAISRNHAELRAEDGKFVLHPCGVNPTSVNGMPLTEPRALAEGDKVVVGSAILTFTTKRLPLGVSVIEPVSASNRDKDISTRRNTIKHPIMNGTLDPDSPRKLPTNGIVMAVMVIAVILYLLGR